MPLYRMVTEKQQSGYCDSVFGSLLQFVLMNKIGRSFLYTIGPAKISASVYCRN